MGGGGGGSEENHGQLRKPKQNKRQSPQSPGLPPHFWAQSTAPRLHHGISGMRQDYVEGAAQPAKESPRRPAAQLPQNGGSSITWEEGIGVGGKASRVQDSLVLTNILPPPLVSEE